MATERAVGKYAKPPLPREKGTKRQIVRLERVKVSESRALAREGRIRAGEWRGKGGLHSEGRQVSRKWRWVTKENLPMRSRRKHERVSRRKSSLGGSAESWFQSKSGQT